MVNFKLTALMQRWYYPWLVWGLAATFFFVEYFARVAPGVMVDELMRDLHVMGFALGGLSACFYYAYISMQIPVGMLADRFSPRWLLTIMTLVTGWGCILFSDAHNIQTAAFARVVIGFGSSFAFVTALKLAASWFSATRFGLLAGMTQALGMLGAAVGQAPMAYSVGHIGWRPTMWVIAVLFILLALATGFLVRDCPPANGRQSENARLTTIKEVLVGFGAVLKNPQTWWNGLYAGLIYAPTEALAELWGVKFFQQTHDLSNTMAAVGTGLIFIGWAVGGPLAGWVSDFTRRRRPLMLLSAALSLILILIALYWPHLPVPVLFSLLFLYGMVSTGLGISYAVAAEINPRVLAGTSMAFANMASVLIGAALQPFIGWLLDRHWDGKILNHVPVYTAHDFRVAMILLPVCLVIALLAATRVQETYCRAK